MRNSMLFEATSINGMNLANRFVRSATWEGMADKGCVTEKLTDLLVALARGGGRVDHQRLHLREARRPIPSGTDGGLRDQIAAGDARHDRSGSFGRREDRSAVGSRGLQREFQFKRLGA